MRKTLLALSLAAMTLAAGPAAAECGYRTGDLSVSLYWLDPFQDPVPLDAIERLLPTLDDPPPRTLPQQEDVDPEVTALRDQLAEAIVRRLRTADAADGALVRTLGDGRILAQAGADDRAAYLLFFQRGNLGFFHVVRLGGIAEDPAPGEIVAWNAGSDRAYVLEAEPILTEANLTDSGLGYHPRTGLPVVNFRFDDAGREILAAHTASHVGDLLAIVLDGEVLVAPRILTPILGGAGFIEGDFSVDGARAMAVLLRSDPLPVPVRLLHRRLAGPFYNNGAIRQAAVLIEFDLRKPAALAEVCRRLESRLPADVSLQEVESSRLLVWAELGDHGVPEEVARTAADALKDIADLHQVELAGPNLAGGQTGILGNIRKWFD